MMLFAIVIPYYKIDFFEETLKSVAGQTDKNFKLYIGNDASPDDPFPLIQKYFAEDSYVYFNYDINLGGKNLTLQWERILENVQEEWFQILGDDDILDKNFVKLVNGNILSTKKNDISLMRVNRIVIDDKGSFIKDFFLEGNSIKSNKLIEMGYLGKTVTSLSEFIFLKDVYQIYKFEDIPLAWGADVLGILTISRFSNIMLCNKTFVCVRISESSITGNTTTLREAKQNAFNIFREVLLNKYSKHFDINFIDIVVKDYFSYCWSQNKKTNLSLINIYFKRGFILKGLKKCYRILQINRKVKQNLNE